MADDKGGYEVEEKEKGKARREMKGWMTSGNGKVDNKGEAPKQMHRNNARNKSTKHMSKTTPRKNAEATPKQMARGKKCKGK